MEMARPVEVLPGWLSVLVGLGGIVMQREECCWDGGDKVDGTEIDCNVR